MIERDPRLPAPSASALHGESTAEAKAEAVAEVAQALGLSSDPADKPAPDHRGRRPAWLMAMVTIGVLVGGIGIGFIKFVNGPVSTGAIASTPTPSSRPLADKTGTVELGGLHFNMTYPAIFDQVSQLRNDPNALEQYFFSSKGEAGRSLAVMVRPLESNQYQDDASYKFRMIHPDQYKVRLGMILGENIAVMNKTDNTESTLFWAHEGKLITVSVVSTSPKDKVTDLMAVIESKLRWKR